MRKNVLTGLSLLMVAMVAMTGCKGKKTEVTQEETKVLVKTSAAVVEEVDNTGEFTSNIEPNKENNIAPSMALRINKIFVDVGDYVKQGQLLASMDPTQYNTSNTQLANLQVDYDRYKKVYDAGGISKSQMEAQETQLAVLKEQVDNLRENMELRSPISGVVTVRNYDPGDMYAGGLPLLQVMDISSLKVTVAVSEQYFPYVRMNMPAYIKVNIYADKVFEGKVSLIYPAIDASSRTFRVEITIPNAKNELRPGMLSRTTLHFGTVEGVTVEDVAVQKQMGSNEKYLFVAKGGKAERRVVTTGVQKGNRIQILTGVDGGEEVIVAGISRLVNQTEIEVNNN